MPGDTVDDALIFVTEEKPLKCKDGAETDPPAPEKGQIHNRGEGVDKLEDERLEDEPLFKALVRLWNL